MDEVGALPWQGGQQRDQRRGRRRVVALRLRLKHGVPTLEAMPLPLNPDVLGAHRQLSSFSCIPMTVEFLLKRFSRALADVQRDWLAELRKERRLLAAVRLAGPFIMSSQGKP